MCRQKRIGPVILFFLIHDCCLVTPSPPKVGRLSEVSVSCWETIRSSDFWLLLPFKVFLSYCGGSTSVWSSKVHFYILHVLLSLSTQPNSVKFFYSRGTIVKRVTFLGRLMPWSWHIAAFSSCLASSSTGLSGLLQRKVSLMMLRLFCVGVPSPWRCNQTRHLKGFNANEHTK